MKNFSSFDELVVYIINSFAEIFGNHAILKGGMVFKLLGSPRYTNDIDYVFIPYQSKNDIKDDIYNALEKLFPEKVTISVHSKCVRYLLEVNEIKLQIEVNVDLECESIELSTISLAKVNNQTGRIIRAMSYGYLLSHKLAAWNERELVRDLYDIYFLYDVLDEKPDIHVLKKRLANIKSRANKKIKSMSLTDFVAKLENRIVLLSHDDVKTELSDYLDKEEIIGLDKKIKIAVKDLLDYVKGLS